MQNLPFFLSMMCALLFSAVTRPAARTEPARHLIPLRNKESPLTFSDPHQQLASFRSAEKNAPDGAARGWRKGGMEAGRPGGFLRGGGAKVIHFCLYYHPQLMPETPLSKKPHTETEHFYLLQLCCCCFFFSYKNKYNNKNCRCNCNCG